MNFNEENSYLLNNEESELKAFSQDLLKVFLGEKENTENYVVRDSLSEKRYMKREKTGKLSKFLMTLIINHFDRNLKPEYHELLFSQSNWKNNLDFFMTRKTVAPFYGRINASRRYVGRSVNEFKIECGNYFYVKENELRIKFTISEVNTESAFNLSKYADLITLIIPMNFQRPEFLHLNEIYNKSTNVNERTKLLHKKEILIEQFAFDEIRKTGLPFFLKTFEETFLSFFIKDYKKDDKKVNLNHYEIKCNLFKYN